MRRGRVLAPVLASSRPRVLASSPLRLIPRPRRRQQGIDDDLRGLTLAHRHICPYAGTQAYLLSTHAHYTSPSHHACYMRNARCMSTSPVR
jgi:hypothetical protein